LCVEHIEVLKQAIVATVEIRWHKSRLTLCYWIKLIHSLLYDLGVYLYKLFCWKPSRLGKSVIPPVSQRQTRYAVHRSLCNYSCFWYASKDIVWVIIGRK